MHKLNLLRMVIKFAHSRASAPGSFALEHSGAEQISFSRMLNETYQRCSLVVTITVALLLSLLSSATLKCERAFSQRSVCYF